MKKSIFIILALSFIQAGFASNQYLELRRNGMIFSFKLLSSDDLEKNDTLLVKYTVINETDKAVAILDLAIPGKDPLNCISISERDFRVDLELGANGLTWEFARVSKLREIESGGKFSFIFKLPVQSMWDHFSKIPRLQDSLKVGKSFRLKDIDIVAYIAYSDSPEILEGDFSKVLSFEDYFGDTDMGMNYYKIENYMSRFMMSGLTVAINN